MRAHSPVATYRRATGRSSQRGAAAIEFALVSGVFFVMLYFIVSYGAVFIVQQSLSRAAAEGARTLLASQFTTVTGTAGPGTSTLSVSNTATPEQLGRDAAARAVAWLSSFRQARSLPPIVPQVVAGANCAAGMSCRTVTVSYPDYHTYPLVPSLLPASVMPQTLTASATVQLGPAP